MTSQIPFAPLTPEALEKLTPVERQAFVVAAELVACHQKPSMETVVTLVETIQRLITGPSATRPVIVCLCGSTRFYDAFQRANYERTMAGEIVLSVGFYPHAKAVHGHGEGVGHDSAEKVALDELHKRKIDLADYVLVVSDETGYFGESTRSEIAYAIGHGKPVMFTEAAAGREAQAASLTGEPAMRRPSVYELWLQAGGETPEEYDRDRYTELLREHGHLLKPGDEGYGEASRNLPCGWPHRTP